MTTNLKYFCGLTFIFSIIFFDALYTDLSLGSPEKIWIYAILYGLALFFTGLYLGYNDPVQKSRLDLGFHYHLMTFIIVNSIGLISLFIALGFNKNTLLCAIMSIGFWAIGLLVHFYFSSKSIKGISREEIFD